MRIARLVLVIVTAIVTPLAMASACPPKDDGKPAKVPVTFSVVQICLDDTTLIRQEDARCEEGLSSFHWVYVADSAAWPVELPAVGEYIQGGRATPEMPTGVVIGRIPREGARFANP